MSHQSVLNDATIAFETTFSEKPTQVAYAPGRVNLLGEHTDYNGGLVFPMPLALGTAVAFGTGGEIGTIETISTSFDGRVTRGLYDDPDGSWTDYIVGPLAHLLKGGSADSGIRIAVATDLPVGSGLSSSAALEVATLRAACAHFDTRLSDIELAKLARKAENEFVGVPCGIMDQYSVSVGKPGSAVFLNTRTLTSNVVGLPDTHNFVIIHSGVTHKLSEDGYEQRVKECNAACQALGVEMLSDLGMDDLDKIGALPTPLDGRARHIVTENDRVSRAMTALEENNSALFAQCMIESHRSQRDDYGVSLPEIDALVDGALAAGADGARLTGGGFGGSIVAFVTKTKVAAFSKELSAKFPNSPILAVT